MSQYFDQLEAELRAAVARGAAQPAPSRLRVHLRPGDVAAVLAVAVSLAVAVFALALLGHGHRIAKTPATSPTAAHPVPTLPQLLANFAVLRRPQTAADRSWQPTCICGRGSRELPKLTRLAATLSDGDRVFLTVARFRVGGQLNQAAGTYALSVGVVNRHGDATGTNFGPNVDYTVFPFSSPQPRHVQASAPALTWVSIIPDGVTHLRWTFACDPALLPTRCTDRRPVIVDLPVDNNVAAARVAATGECDPRGGICRPPAVVTWYGAGAQVVASFSRTAKSNLTAPPFIPRNSTGPILINAPTKVRDTLGGNGVAGVRFGSRPAAVISALRPLLGSPTTYRRGGSCGLDHTITWSGSDHAFPLTLYLKRGRFLGYQYGQPYQGYQATLPRGRIGLALATTRGLVIGNTLARGRQLYGNAFKITTAQGGSWNARTVGGEIAGYALLNPTNGHIISRKSVVATIDAGDVGCPALSP